MQNVYRCSSMKLLQLGESRKCRKGKRAGYAQTRVRVASRDRVFLARCHDMVLRPSTRPHLGARNRCARARHACVTTACARATELPSLVFLACVAIGLFVATQSSDRLGSLGRDKVGYWQGLLGRDRAVCVATMPHARQQHP